MAKKRVKQPAGVMHVTSRFTGGLRLFNTTSTNPNAPGAPEAEFFSLLMLQLARFHEITILTWTLAQTHFHILLKEPAHRRKEIQDDELVEKVRALNGIDAAQELRAQLTTLRVELDDYAAEALKARYLERIGDVSFFMKELKGRFAQWYNQRHRRHGALWSERFQSVIVETENDGVALKTMASYIDLNCVRAGLVKDPAQYAYCGYGQAAGGSGELADVSREGIATIYGVSCECKTASATDLQHKQQAAVKEYRQLLELGLGIGPGDVEEMLARGESLTPAQLAATRVPQLSRGMVFGSRDFVEQAFARYRNQFGKRRLIGSRPILHLDSKDRERLMVMREF